MQIPRHNSQLPTAPPLLAQRGLLRTLAGMIIAKYRRIADIPVQSLPNGRPLEQALEQLQLMVSMDLYLNETSRHAHIILPTGPAEHEQYDLVSNLFAVHNEAKYAGYFFLKIKAAFPGEARWSFL